MSEGAVGEGAPMNHSAPVGDGARVGRSAMNHGDLVEASFSNFREHRDEAARWLAVEVLLSDPAVLGDDDLVDHLCRLQDRLEAVARVRYGVA